MSIEFDEDITKIFEGDVKETFTSEELEILSEYIETIGSQYSVTRSRDGSIFYSTQMVQFKQSFPKGSTPDTILNYQRIQATNYMQKTYSNKRLKTPIKH